jgi:hypothetical protein
VPNATPEIPNQHQQRLKAVGRGASVEPSKQQGEYDHALERIWD